MSSSLPVRAGIAAAAAPVICVMVVMVVMGLVVALMDPAGGMHPVALLYVLIFLGLMYFAVALLHVLLLGLPIYAILSPARRASLRVNLVASFLIGALPMPLLLILTDQVDLVSGNAAEGVGDVLRIVLFLLGVAGQVGLYGSAGMIGGLTFWLILRKRQAGTLQDTDVSISSTQPGTRSPARPVRFS